MFRLTLLVAGFSLVVAQLGSHDMPKCIRLVHGGMSCCKTEIPKHSPPSDDLKECFQMQRKPPSCEVDLCIAKKKGIASADGTVDMKAFAADVEKTFGSDSDLSNSIIKNCIDGDVSKYGREDFCDLRKIKVCSDIQVVKSCNEWKNEGDCKGMKEIADDCVKQFA